MRQKKLYTDIKKEQSAEKCEGGGRAENTCI
jgi:hypothetical protein